MRPATEKFKMHFLKPCTLWKWLLLPGVLLGVMQASLVFAQNPCQLYSGEKTWEALQDRKTALEQGGIDHCEMANIYYQLARNTDDLQSSAPKVQYLDQCIASADRAIQQDTQAGAAYFLKGLCLGRQGEHQGLWASLKIIDPVRENMEIAAKINPAIDRGGPHRALGRMYYELPVFLGGSLDKSIHHLKQSIKYGPGYWQNHFFLAESVFSLTRYEETKDALTEAMKLSAQDPDRSNATKRQQQLEELMDSLNEQCPDLSCSMN